ncbi:MAG: hypothetical protein LBI86_08800 [Treponema sp.]|jgi:hypothetical protein|nr:hypothetical protein [Treponema sp.]
MASEKKPSIYYDRGTIGSSAELDEYGVWVKSEPQDLSGAEGQEFPESSPPSFGAADSGFDPLTDSDDLSSLPDLDIPDEDSLSGLDDLGLPEPDDGEDLSGAAEKETGDSGEEGFTEISMDDFLEPVESDLTEPVPVKEKNPDGDLSTRLLMKIADELASIRTELTTLKKEFAVVKGESPAEDRGDSQNRGGFFDEEDDEKIALTGDELDNILNTADFTEETGADATEELTDSFPETDDTGSFDITGNVPLPGMLSDQEDIIGSGESEAAIKENNESVSAADDAGIDFDVGESGLDELESGTKVEDQVPDFSFDNFDDGDELKQLREEGAMPMTSPPEDTTYLEEDPLAAEKTETENELSPEEDTTGEFALDDLSLDESSLDLSEAVIDEPDLSAGITENPLREPSLDDFSLDDDISINLDLPEPEEKPAPDGENVPEDVSIELSDEDTAFDISAEEGDIQIQDESPVPGIQEEDISLPDVSAEDISLPDVSEDDLSFSDVSAEDISFPDISADDITEEVSFEDTPELPSVKSSDDDSFAPVIPEGFIVEADDSSVPFEDDIEEKEVLADGIAALDETAEAETLSGAEAGTADIPRETEDAGPADEGLDDDTADIPSNIKQELKTVLSYMDQLLESLPDDKIEEFARSEYFDTYKKLFRELGLV